MFCSYCLMVVVCSTFFFEEVVGNNGTIAHNIEVDNSKGKLFFYISCPCLFLHTSRVLPFSSG